jgi:hypothetical protein
MVIFEKADEATQEDVKTVTNFLEERFPVIGSTTAKAPANMQMKELAQKKDESIDDYYRRSQGLMSKLGTTDRKKDGSSMRKAKAHILKELVNHFIGGLYDNKLRQSICDSDYWYECDAMWKAYDLVNRKSTILKRREEDATKSNNEAKAKLFDKVLKGKFNTPADLQSFIAQADASLKGQAMPYQVPQQQNR